MVDVDRRYVRSFTHRHKQKVRPTGFGQEGPAELREIIEQVDPLIQGRGSEEARTIVMRDPDNKAVSFIADQIYPQAPHIAGDNHFFSDNIADLLGEKGYGGTFTTRRDRFPGGLKDYCHREKVSPGDHKAKAMRYQNPILARKQVPADGGKKAYTRTLTSFQSTGATNISGVNNLPSLGLHVQPKSRGRGNSKLWWGIEMNEARALYLAFYFGVDNIDHMISNAGIKFISWKYWHAAALHFLSMAVTSAYDMYIECCEGNLDPSWFVEEKDRASFSEFRQVLSEQMLKYDPRNDKLPGDRKFRRSTQQPKKRRGGSSSSSTATGYDGNGLTVRNVKRAKLDNRFCNNLDEFMEHLESAKVDSNNNSAPCQVCGAKTLWKCELCGVRCCAGKKKWDGVQCFSRFHNIKYFGLPRCDSHIHGVLQKDWKKPNEREVNHNKRDIELIFQEIEYAEIASTT